MSELASMVRDDVPFAEYAKWDAVNQSRLKLIQKSPLHYKTKPVQDSAAFADGRSIHTMALQPERYPLEYAVWPDDYGRRYGKKWNEFKSLHDGKDIVREQDYNQHLEIGRAIGRHPASELLESGRPEVSILCETQHGFDIKCRIDWLRDDCIVDLKTTANIEPNKFERDAYNYGYHFQAAWYQMCVRRATGDNLPFVILAVEKTNPYDVAAYRLSDELMDKGREEMMDAIYLLERCMESDTWPGVNNGEPMELGLPSWAKTKPEEALIDTLIINGEEVSL